MGKTIAQKGANVGKDGIRHKDVYATAVGDSTKAYFFLGEKMETVPVVGCPAQDSKVREAAELVQRAARKAQTSDRIESPFSFFDQLT